VHTSALTAILQTKNLRYLNISRLKYETLPEVILDIWSFQALHVMFSDLVKLPESIGKLQKLRVVNLSCCFNLTSLPDSIGNCVMISSINLFGCVKVVTLPSSISRNKRLRVLRLGGTKIERLPSSITTLENLECLDLQRCSELVELPDGIGNLKKVVVLNLQGCGMLLAIPKGVGQLTRLERLGLYVMGVDENDAQISELENVNKIIGELTIRGIAHGVGPDVAHKEWLKQKTNLQSLTLICASNVGVNSENQLEGLEPPSGIKNLKVIRYSGQESTQWMMKHVGAEVAGHPCFRLLIKLELSDFPKLERLDGLTELPCLEKLVLKEMTALKSISGGPFPSLLELFMDGSLGVVWMVTDERSLADLEGGQLQIGNCLSVVTIQECPKLMVMPYFPLSLKVLCLVNSNVQLLGLPGLGLGCALPSFSFSCLKELQLKDMPAPAAAVLYGSGCRWELVQHLTALESLQILSRDGLTELPESMRSLASLRTLTISWCSALMLPEWMGELRHLESMHILGTIRSMQPLRALKALHILYSGRVGDLCCLSLQTLVIDRCDSISSLPQSFRLLISLWDLKIIRCRDLHQLSECLGELRSLQMLWIEELPRLKTLPQSFGHLTSLQELQIHFCNALDQLPDCVGKLHSLCIFKIWWLRSLRCLPPSLGQLTSLQELEIGRCKALGQLPESLGELRSLRKFEIWGLRGLTSVPKSMCCLTSLEQLTIIICPGIKSLAEWITGLTALQTLEISRCPDLERHCERRKGKDWHLISRIPHLRIGEF
jgi:Leucine-rich repeat (LRR) protein